MFAPDQARRTIFLQTLIAGRKSRERERERERLRGVCTRIFCFGFVSYISKRNALVSQSILLQLLPMRTQNPKLIVRVGFCTAKSDIPQYNM